MMEKTKSQKTGRRRDPLGKSFADILLQTSIRETSGPSMSRTKAVEKHAEIGATGVTQSKQMEEESRESLNMRVIGSILREKRQQKGLALDRISDQLCLKVSFLNSIEKGTWQDMPHKVYVRGYVRKYADLLGVQGEILPYLFGDDSAQKNTDKPTAETTPRTAVRRLSLSQSRKPFWTTLLYAAIIVLTLGFFLVESVKRQGAETSNLEKAVQVSSAVNENDTKKTVPSFTDIKKLMITCHERTWISVIIDGTEKKEFTLKPQEVVILNAKEKFDLLIGNAGGIRLLLDGKDTNFSGENGQVKRVTF